MMTASGGLQPSRRGGRAPPVEIIIYGRGALSELKVSLRSLKALDYRAPLKITLAFDASADGIKRRLADLAEKESLELHQEEEPAGFARTINGALERRQRSEFTVLMAAASLSRPVGSIT